MANLILAIILIVQNLTASYDGSTFVESGQLAGANYRIRVPDNYNGQLVLMLRGYVAPVAGPGALTDNVFLPLAQALNQQGYAVAYSGYRANGFMADDSYYSTKALQGYFSQKYGQSAKTWLIGQSMGANTAIRLTEQSTDYSGVLSLCGVASSIADWYKYYQDFKVVFDYWTKDALAGVTADNFNSSNASAYIGNLFATDPRSAWLISAATGVYAERYTFQSVLYLQLLATLDIQAHLGGQPYSNQNVQYSLPAGYETEQAAMNAGVRRFGAKSWATSNLDKYTTTGQAKAPVLLITNDFDPLVTASQSLNYYSKDANSSVQVVRAFAHGLSATTPQHCDFLLSEQVRAFGELAGWGNGGAKPTVMQDITGG